MSSIVQMAEKKAQQKSLPTWPCSKGSRDCEENKEKEQKAVDYASEGVCNHNIFDLSGSDWQLLGILTIIASLVRLFRISQPNRVVFDEVHFGGFASKYVKGQFFLDVHPPLAKLLITLAGWLMGYNGEFGFDHNGQNYEPQVPYTTMRLIPAICGILTVSVMFLTLKAAGCRSLTATLGAGLITFDNALVTQSRFILLDSPLILSMASTALSWICFMNQHEQGVIKAFTPSWWFWLVSTGVSLGATVSMKWVGLFTMGWVGSLTLIQLWVLFGDPQNVSISLLFKHVAARFLCLLIIPTCFYISMFGIHFWFLGNPGEGSKFMSPEFQATLNITRPDIPADVAHGSHVSIRHWNTHGYLHSHNHVYLNGSRQQQVTVYQGKDENNVWTIENETRPISFAIKNHIAWNNLSSAYIEDGAVIRLNHMSTNRRLHAHGIPAPITTEYDEVSAYGHKGFEGDENGLFRVEIDKFHSESATARTRLRAIQSKFRLRHLTTGCVLHSHNVKLPDWGFRQQEATCVHNDALSSTIWYIEGNLHPFMDSTAEKINYRKISFFNKFWELHKVMWHHNAALIQPHPWASRPSSWPLLGRGINFWVEYDRQVYLVGNPLIWWSSTAVLGFYVVIHAVAILCWQRGYRTFGAAFKRSGYEIGVSFLGWVFHYVPFFFMSRSLFLHHYLPALYFAVLALCQMYDFASYRIKVLSVKQVTSQAIGYGFLALAVTSFVIYSPLAYGNTWTSKQCNRFQLIGAWDIDCNRFSSPKSSVSLTDSSKSC